MKIRAAIHPAENGNYFIGIRTYSSFRANPPQQEGRRAQPRLGFSIFSYGETDHYLL